MVKKCKRGETNTRREDIFAMRAGVGVNLGPVTNCRFMCVDLCFYWFTEFLEGHILEINALPGHETQQSILKHQNYFVFWTVHFQ